MGRFAQSAQSLRNKGRAFPDVFGRAYLVGSVMAGSVRTRPNEGLRLKTRRNRPSYRHRYGNLSLHCWSVSFAR